MKHFVESRKNELIGRHDNVYILNRLDIILNNLEEIIKNHDDYEIIENKHYLSKIFRNIEFSQIRIVLESIDDHYEIVTMHFKKLKTPSL